MGREGNLNVFLAEYSFWRYHAAALCFTCDKWLFGFTGMLPLLQFASLKQNLDWGGSWNSVGWDLMGTCCVEWWCARVEWDDSMVLHQLSLLEGIVFSIPVLGCLYASSNNHLFYPLAHFLVGSFSAEFISWAFAKEPDDYFCVRAVCGGCGIDHVTEHGRREQDSSSPSSIRAVFCSL